MQLLDGHVASLQQQLLEMKEASASTSEVVNTNLEGLSNEVKLCDLQWYSIMRNTLAFPGSLASLSKCVKYIKFH